MSGQIFQYQSEAGQVIEERFSTVKAAPPAFVEREGVRYFRVYGVPYVGGVKGTTGGRKSKDSRSTGSAVPSHAFTEGLPVSFTLPVDDRPGTVVRRGGHLVREHGDGTHSTLNGQRIIDSNKAAREACAQTGYSLDGSKPK